MLVVLQGTKEPLIFFITVSTIMSLVFAFHTIVRRIQGRQRRTCLLLLLLLEGRQPIIRYAAAIGERQFRQGTLP